MPTGLAGRILAALDRLLVHDLAVVREVREERAERRLQVEDRPRCALATSTASMTCRAARTRWRSSGRGSARRCTSTSCAVNFSPLWNVAFGDEVERPRRGVGLRPLRREDAVELLRAGSMSIELAEDVVVDLGAGVDLRHVRVEAVRLAGQRRLQRRRPPSGRCRRCRWSSRRSPCRRTPQTPPSARPRRPRRSAARAKSWRRLIAPAGSAPPGVGGAASLERCLHVSSWVGRRRGHERLLQNSSSAWLNGRGAPSRQA